MIRRSSLRWRLVAWVTGVLLAVAIVTFAVIYLQTGSELRSQIDGDVRGDAAQLSEAIVGLKPSSAQALLADVRRYVLAQPFTATSSLLFAMVPGAGTVSNHPEVFGDARPDDGENALEQQRENTLGLALLAGPVGLTTRDVPDVGRVRIQERLVTAGGLRVRVGAGEPLEIVARAQRSIAKSFALAGGLALILALIASYLAGATVSAPLRRMAKVAARVDDGDLQPRMHLPPSASSETHVLAESFNHMLDRLSDAFDAQRDFIADASHELRTPLTVIAGQIEVLAAQPEPAPAEVRRVQRLVSAEIARTSRLVDDMLLLARSERRDFLQCREIELRPFIANLWAAASVTAERRFELEEAAGGFVIADPDRLAQALRNLIRNAIEHTNPPDGLVRLEVQRRAGDRICFAILDDGPGIDADQRERIFERFHRTDQSRARIGGGAGLGLAIVQTIVEAHGGDVRALERPSGGARLELLIPGTVRSSINPRQPSRAGSPSQTRLETV